MECAAFGQTCGEIMELLTRALLLAVLLFAPGCSRTVVQEEPEPPPSPNEGVKLVQVNLFDTTEVVGRSDVDPEKVASAIARSMVTMLREYGMKGKLTTNATPTPDTVTVTGRLVELDGGNRAARAFAPGAGAARVAVEGEAYRGDKLLGKFSAVSKSGYGFFFGGNSDNLIDNCAVHVGEVVAQMVETGEYYDYE